MKSLSVATVVRFALFLGVMLCLAKVGVAEGESNGLVSKQLANQFFCDITDSLEGDIGLLIGLVMVFAGLWSLVQGSKIANALPIMIIGAFVTAMPSLIMSSLTGLGTLLKEANITKTPFEAPSCPPLTPTQDAVKNAMKNSSGQYYPSRGVYDPAKLINGMTPDIKYDPQLPNFNN